MRGSSAFLGNPLQNLAYLKSKLGKNLHVFVSEAFFFDSVDNLGHGYFIFIFGDNITCELNEWVLCLIK